MGVFGVAGASASLVLGVEGLDSPLRLERTSNEARSKGLGVPGMGLHHPANAACAIRGIRSSVIDETSGSKHYRRERSEGDSTMARLVEA